MKNWLQLKVSILKIMRSWSCLNHEFCNNYSGEFDWVWRTFKTMQYEIKSNYELDYTIKELKAGMKILKKQKIVDYTYTIDMCDYYVSGSGYFLTEI